MHAASEKVTANNKLVQSLIATIHLASNNSKSSSSPLVINVDWNHIRIGISRKLILRNPRYAVPEFKHPAMALRSWKDLEVNGVGIMRVDSSYSTAFLAFLSLFVR